MNYLNITMNYLEYSKEVDISNKIKINEILKILALQ